MFTKYKLVRQLMPLLLALLLACKKDDTNPDTTGIRLFTNKMEITDVAVKSDFLKRAPVGFREIAPSSLNYQVRFSAPDTAVFGSEMIKFVATKKDARYVFFSLSATYFSTSEMLLHDILKYIAPVYSFPITVGLGQSTSEVRVGYDKGNQLQLSYLQYCWRRPGRWTGGFLYNEFNETAIAKVSATDTLAVRTGSLTIAVAR